MYVLFYVLYKGPELTRILVSVKGSGMNILQILRDDYSFGGVKSYMQRFSGAGIGALTPVLFKGQRYFQERSFISFEKGVVTA